MHVLAMSAIAMAFTVKALNYVICFGLHGNVIRW